MLASLFDSAHPLGYGGRSASRSDYAPSYYLQVSFTSNKIFCDVAVESIMHTQKNTPVKYSFKKFLQTAEYIVQ